MDLDAMLASVKRVEYLPENDLKKLCECASRSLCLERALCTPRKPQVSHPETLRCGAGM